MPASIADYAFLADGRTGALVSRDGSIDWLCLPRFDSASVFGALLGDDEHGSWGLRPTDPTATSSRGYLGRTFELVTRWETASGVAEVHDVMPVLPLQDGSGWRSDLIRQVRGVSGEVEFASTVRLRFDYARAMPWVRQVGSHREPAMVGIAGPSAVVIRGCRMRPAGLSHTGTVMVSAGDEASLVLTHYPSHLKPPEALDVAHAMERTRGWWEDWAARIDSADAHAETVIRAILILRALTNRATGGIVAAATTSLPEDPGGERNWDYRYVWLRDAALTLEVMVDHGFQGIARHWRDWLVRAIAGDPAEMQIMYGVAGERDLPEREPSTLPGYRGAHPVRIGNGAVGQFQADVAGEVMAGLHAAREAGLDDDRYSWPMQRAILARSVATFDLPDNGIWEVRGEPQMFTQSRAMIWAAFDRGVQAVERFGLEGPGEVWRRMRDKAREQIDQQGVAAGGWFRQRFGSDDVDASLLLLPHVGFCAYDDPRMLATVERIEQQLLLGGMVLRYRTDEGLNALDGLSGNDHPFFACSFWLVEQYAMSGRQADAEEMLDRLCALANDVGMLSEEYDVEAGEQLGNTPQALSHLALVRAADAVSRMRS